MKTIITFGTFDVLHIGHIQILKRASNYGEKLIVGVSSDSLNYKKKGRNPIYPEKERVEIISSLECVSEVFIEESLELKGFYIKKYNADILIMGDDWKGRFDHYNELCQVVYLPRTEGISTSQLIAEIKKYG